MGGSWKSGTTMREDLVRVTHHLHIYGMELFPVAVLGLHGKWDNQFNMGAIDGTDATRDAAKCMESNFRVGDLLGRAW